MPTLVATTGKMARVTSKLRSRSRLTLRRCTVAETSELLRFEGVVAGYGGGDVLKGISFDVAHGGVTCIVGPNGSGKSTLLKTVSGLVKPRLGEIYFKGTPLVGKSPRDILKLGIVQVPQN